MSDLEKNKQPADHISSSDKKYSQNSICNPKKLKKGQTRWNQYTEALQKINPETLPGPMLDFGCGIGYFVREGLRRKMKIWGVDMNPGKIKRYARLIEYTASPSYWKHRCIAADGKYLPFDTGTFTAVSSWYVFEHIQNPASIIREMVRITRPGGIITIRAQDARNFWEGHCKIPWIPFMPGHLSRVWMEEFEKSPSLRDGVYDITQPQFISILEALGCRIAIQAPPPEILIENHWQFTTEDQIRHTARRVKAAFESGEWQPQPENLYIHAQKK